MGGRTLAFLPFLMYFPGYVTKCSVAPMRKISLISYSLSPRSENLGAYHSGGILKAYFNMIMTSKTYTINYE